MTGDGVTVSSGEPRAPAFVVTVNGEAQQVPLGTTVAELVATIAGAAAGVAVAVDREVVPRSAWAEVVLGPGASVEVVTAAAGG